MRFARIAIALFLPWILGCSDENAQIAYSLPDTFQTTDQIRYRIDGGGEIDFTLKQSTGFYQVDVTRYNYGASGESFVITESELSADDSQLLSALFTGVANLGGVVYVSEAPTGTWTYVYIRRDSAWLRVASPDVIDGLKSVCDLVVHHLP